MRKTIDPALLDLRDAYRFSDNDIKRVESALMIHKAHISKNLGNEVFQMVVMSAKGVILGVVRLDGDSSVFVVVER